MMNKNIVSKERFNLRDEYARETNQTVSENIPLYADWLETKLAELRFREKHGLSEEEMNYNPDQILGRET